jgi:ABC-type multidrug transport system ATPase subunit
MIDVVDVSHHYGLRPILSHINLKIPPGQLVALMGANGVGKSTLLNIIAGIMSPAKGHVEINGLRRRADEQTELQIRKLTSYLADHPWLPEFMTGREWLLAIGRLYDLEADRLMDHISRLLDLFQLSDKGEAPIRTYSNGQKKKIAICGALVPETPILVMDEPFTGGLDPSAILALSRVLKLLAERNGVTMVMSSQIAEMVELTAHRIAILDQASIVAYDTLEGLRAKSGCNGSLPEVFERIVRPRTVEQIENYFKRPPA